MRGQWLAIVQSERRIIHDSRCFGKMPFLIGAVYQGILNYQFGKVPKTT